MSSIKRFAADNGLSLAIFGLFLVFFIGQSVAGHYAYNDERAQHGEPRVGYLQFLTSGRMLEAAAENWESEFLEMCAFVLLTTFLHQKGSVQSETGYEEEARKRHASPSRKRQAGGRRPAGHEGASGTRRWLHEHSLALALGALFCAALLLHAYGGLRDYNEDQRSHGGQSISFHEFLATPEFWFQSLQNWQSEFLGLGTFIVLSIALRQRGSAESKPVHPGGDAS
jgi:hypothetical protein